MRQSQHAGERRPQKPPPGKQGRQTRANRHKQALQQLQPRLRAEATLGRGTDDVSLCHQLSEQVFTELSPHRLVCSWPPHWLVGCLAFVGGTEIDAGIRPSQTLLLGRW